jgi:hypothetical protein
LMKNSLFSLCKDKCLTKTCIAFVSTWLQNMI